MPIQTVLSPAFVHPFAHAPSRSDGSAKLAMWRRIGVVQDVLAASAVRLAGLALVALASVNASAQVSDATLRQTTVTLVITNSRHYSGTYQASGIARACGTVDLGFPNRVKSFTVEFPDDEPDLPVRSVNFDAEDLPVGTTTTRFNLAVGISGPKVGKPPLFVVNPARQGSRETGTAKLEHNNGVTTLTLTGTDAMGVNLALTVVSQPKK